MLAKNFMFYVFGESFSVQRDLFFFSYCSEKCFIVRQ